MKELQIFNSEEFGDIRTVTIENELVYLKNDEAVCSSLQVADKFGKRHDRVLRAIDNLLETLPKNG